MAWGIRVFVLFFLTLNFASGEIREGRTALPSLCVNVDQWAGSSSYVWGTTALGSPELIDTKTGQIKACGVDPQLNPRVLRHSTACYGMGGNGGFPSLKIHDVATGEIVTVDRLPPNTVSAYPSPDLRKLLIVQSINYKISLVDLDEYRRDRLAGRPQPIGFYMETVVAQSLGLAVPAGIWSPDSSHFFFMTQGTRDWSNEEASYQTSYNACMQRSFDKPRCVPSDYASNLVWVASDRVRVIPAIGRDLVEFSSNESEKPKQISVSGPGSVSAMNETLALTRDGSRTRLVDIQQNKTVLVSSYNDGDISPDGTRLLLAKRSNLPTCTEALNIPISDLSKVVKDLGLIPEELWPASVKKIPSAIPQWLVDADHAADFFDLKVTQVQPLGNRPVFYIYVSLEAKDAMDFNGIMLSSYGGLLLTLKDASGQVIGQFPPPQSNPSLQLAFVVPPGGSRSVWGSPAYIGTSSTGIATASEYTVEAALRGYEKKLKTSYRFKF